MGGGVSTNCDDFDHITEGDVKMIVGEGKFESDLFESISQGQDFISREDLRKLLSDQSTDNCFCQKGVKLSFLNDFITNCGGERVLYDLSTWEVFDKFINPKTAETKSSYCDTLTYCENANVFIRCITLY
jgi:hypothetical protein